MSWVSHHRLYYSLYRLYHCYPLTACIHLLHVYGEGGGESWVGRGEGERGKEREKGRERYEMKEEDAHDTESDSDDEQVIPAPEEPALPTRSSRRVQTAPVKYRPPSRQTKLDRFNNDDTFRKKRDIKKAMKKRERGKGKARYEKDRGKRKERYETDRGNGKERYCERERGKERQMETVVFAVVARAYIVVHAN